MTPEERRELAKRLAVEHQHTTPSGKVGLCTCRACDDLRRAAAALCEDADMRQRCPECGGYGWIAEPDPSTGEPINPQQCPTCRGDAVLPDAVVIPRSAIPDDLPGDLLEMAEEVSEYRRALGDHDRLVTAARLLSGGATEGRTCWPEEGT